MKNRTIIQFDQSCCRRRIYMVQVIFSWFLSSLASLCKYANLLLHEKSPFLCLFLYSCLFTSGESFDFQLDFSS